MASINLSTLAVCDQGTQYYNKIYVEPGTGIERDSAVDAYDNNTDIHADSLKDVLGELDMSGLHSITSTLNLDGNYLLHLSRGNRVRKESASVFFRIYALEQQQLQNLMAGNRATAVEIINIFINQRMVKVKVRKEDGRVEDRIGVNESEFTISISGVKYYLIFDVVGIGYHVTGEEYEMVSYNGNVLQSSTIYLN